MDYKDYDLIIHTLKDYKTNPYELLLLFNVMQTSNKQKDISYKKYFSRYIYEITHKYYLRKGIELENKLEYNTKELCSEINNIMTNETIAKVSAYETFRLILFILEFFDGFEVIDYHGSATKLKTQLGEYFSHELPRVLTEDEAELFNEGKWLEVVPVIIMLANIQLCGFVRIESAKDNEKTFMKNISSEEEYKNLIDYYKDKWYSLLEDEC
ncbi:MAG: hypothetical protein BZ138_08065 [Methanosphaera sp. rholeuAM270]|nr:MAG: hypothetical protein BZ138_08065 [Methanosphaera sp. rholeuAM270]